MGCRIERKVGNVANSLERARKEAAKFGSRWAGDENAGDYTLRTPLGVVEGTYTVTADVVCFDIAKKPGVVPCALIQRVLDQFLRSG